MQRHRNPANGFRSNPIGIGGGGAGGGGGGYRSYNRGGFGRGQPHPPRRIDVFMEAGKLATEYLVSKGLLPPNSVNGKWQNSNLKNQIRARRTTTATLGLGSFKNPAVELNRSSLYSEKVNKGLSDKQGDGESFSGSMEELKIGKDGAGDDQKSVSSPDENAGVKTPVSEENVNAVGTDDVAMDEGEGKGKGNLESEKPIVKPIVEEDPAEEDNKDSEDNEDGNKTANNNSSDLLTLIRFNKIPTRTRSSVTLKGSKSDPVLISGDESMKKQEDENQVLNCEPELEVKIEQDDHKYEFGQGQGLHTRSLSFPQRSSISDQELSEGRHGFTRSSSGLIGEKRPLELEVNDSTEAVKKPRDWPSANPQADDFFHISSSRDRASSQEGTPGIITEEQQFFPSSFKMRDLNLMEVSDVRDNHGTNSAIDFSSVVQAKQEPVSVDFDLTMNSSCNLTDRHGKGVEVIDLDCDSMQEDDDNDNDNDNDNNNSERREEAIFTDLGSFPDSMQRVSDMPQDGYGLMISELLDADIPNSSVSTGVNSLHNEMGLPNEEGMLADDESIYMSLGEIPISMPKL